MGEHSAIGGGAETDRAHTGIVPAPENSVVLSCSSLLPYLDSAQEKMHTHLPVIIIDRIHHAEPEHMKDVIAQELAKLPESITHVLVAMGFCGGAWDHVTPDRTVVIPRVDDCVSMLLHRDDAYHPNLKEPGHLYLYEQNPADFSVLSLLRDYTAVGDEFRGMDPDLLFHMWFDQYHYMDIIDTGYNDCYTEEYAAAAQENADQIGAALDYVEGSNRVLEKLVTGRWDEQFLVAPPGHLILHGDFF